MLVVELLGLGLGGSRLTGAAPSARHMRVTARHVCWGTVLFYLARVLVHPFGLRRRLKMGSELCQSMEERTTGKARA